MKKTKQILAIVGIVLLLLMYGSTLIFALMKNPNAQAWFRGSIACTIFVPVLLFAIQLVYRNLKPQKSPLIDNLVFDVGNVLVSFDWKGHMENLGYSEDTIRELSEILVTDPLWNEFDRNVRSYEDIVGEFCRKHPEQAENIRRFTDTVDQTIRRYPFTDNWLQELKSRGYNLYILSNWSEYTYERAKQDALNFEQYVEGAIWSFQVKCIKPERAIYQKLLTTYHLDPKRTLFMDDRQENIDGAKKLGINTLLVNDHATLVKQLAAMGIK